MALLLHLYCFLAPWSCRLLIVLWSSVVVLNGCRILWSHCMVVSYCHHIVSLYNADVSSVRLKSNQYVQPHTFHTYNNTPACYMYPSSHLPLFQHMIMEQVLSCPVKLVIIGATTHVSYLQIRLQRPPMLTNTVAACLSPLKALSPCLILSCFSSCLVVSSHSPILFLCLLCHLNLSCCLVISLSRLVVSLSCPIIL